MKQELTTAHAVQRAFSLKDNFLSFFEICPPDLSRRAFLTFNAICIFSGSLGQLP